MSIKANDYITLDEAEYVLDSLRKCKNPFNCPHGRPTTISMSKYEDTISSENAYKVLDNAVANINKLDIRPIQVVLELVENPTIQCAQQCE